MRCHLAVFFSSCSVRATVFSVMSGRMEETPSSTAFWTMSSMFPPFGMAWMRFILCGADDFSGFEVSFISMSSLLIVVIWPFADVPSPSNISTVSPCFDLRTREQ